MMLLMIQLMLLLTLTQQGQSNSATSLRRLTNIINSYPSPSPDGKRLVFQSNRTGRFELYVVNSDGSGITQITNEPGGNVTPAWSPDGKHIAFAATPDGAADIFIVNADGTGRKRLTDAPGDDEHPHWTADGSRIFFDSARTTPNLNVDWDEQWHEAFSMRPDGTDLRQHTHCRAVCTFASLSPDGRHISYRKLLKTPGFSWELIPTENNSEVFIADVDGQHEVNLSNSAAYDGWPQWSPDSQRIAFTSNRRGPTSVGQIYIIKADGTELRRITAGPWSHAQPVWSPDGHTIYAYELQEDEDGEFGNLVAIQLSAVSAGSNSK